MFSKVNISPTIIIIISVTLFSACVSPLMLQDARMLLRGKGYQASAPTFAHASSSDLAVDSAVAERHFANSGSALQTFEEGRRVSSRLFALNTQLVIQEIRVSAGTDDAEEDVAGSVNTTSSDLELVADLGISQTVGMRFNGVEIPQGATVTTAYVQFQVDESSSESTSLSIQGEATDDATPFISGDFDLSSRPLTAAAVSWAPPAWTVVAEAGPDQRTPDIAPVIQEIVDRSGWSIENSLAIIITGSGRRVAESYNGAPAAAPLLHLEYLVSDQQPPVVDAGADQTVAISNDAFLDGTVTDDGLPDPPGAVTTTWTQMSGPGTVTFADATAVDTVASFSLTGVYVLRLKAIDGERITRDEVTITVNPTAAPPVISSFSPTSAQVAMVVSLNGSNFSDAVAVYLDGIAANYRIVSDSEIHVTVPDGGTTGLIQVANATGTGSSSNNFTVVPSPAVLVGAGDIADCGSNQNDEETARLLDNIAGTVVALGDNAYPDGTDQEYRDCYDPTWGRHKARTRPAPGNHDYRIPGAAGYYNYFGPAAGERGKGYYSYDLGGWHIIALNSECGDVGGCSASSPQGQWLQADLAANSSVCTLAYWHIPRFGSSAGRGSNTRYQDFWQLLYDAGADVVLNGHDHGYERFAPQDPTGLADPTRGLREFVVGTGGKSLYSFGPPEPNSEVREASTHGVIKLTLHATSYDWEFVPIAGQTFTDSGSGVCYQGNGSPEVDAGADQTVIFPAGANLNGSVTDDGTPNPPGVTTLSWSQISGPGTATFGDVSSASTSVTFSEIGTYVLRLTADDGQFSVSDDVSILVAEEGPEIITLETRVAAGSDDAEESESGVVTRASSDLELVFDGSNQTVGIRFAGVAVPQGATIVKAYVQFQTDESTAAPTDLHVWGQADVNASTFAGSAGNISSRIKTVAAVQWSPTAWSQVGQAGPDQRTSDVGAIVQEIVNQPGWSNGNSLAVVISGTGRRVAESFDGVPGAAPLLHVEYQSDPPHSQPPGQVTQVAPVGAITGSTPNFVWQAEPTANAYTLVIYRVDTDQIIYMNSYHSTAVCGSSECVVQPTSQEVALPSGSYTWLVKASNGAGEGPWSVYNP